MAQQTFVQRVLSAKSGKRCDVGDVVVCDPDLILGTDGSTPMAIDLFEQMGGRKVFHPERVLLARDHYAPPTSGAARAYHARMERFAADHELELLPVGDGISFVVALQSGRVHPGDLVIGADSHTVSCGAAGALATSVGSTDLAAALLTGEVWLRVPETIRVIIDGGLHRGVGAKDIGLEIVRVLGADGSNYKALEFVGPLSEALPFEDRMVISNMCAETGAKAAIFASHPWCADEDACYVGEVSINCSQLEPLVALPHDPSNGVKVSSVVGTAVDWVLLGTCCCSSADDFSDALSLLDAQGGIADQVTLVVVPPSARVRKQLEADGTLKRFRALGADIAETGCGPCCGTSGPIPPPNARIMSTANRNFRGRMGEAGAFIHLASPVTCAAAATEGRIVDPRNLL